MEVGVGIPSPGANKSGWSEPGEGDRLPQGTPDIRPEFPHVPTQPLLDSEKKSPSILVRVLPVTLLPLLQEMQPLGTLLASQAMFHNSSHREGMGRVGKHASLDPDLGYWVRDVPQVGRHTQVQSQAQEALCPTCTGLWEQLACRQKSARSVYLPSISDIAKIYKVSCTESPMGTNMN